MEYIDNLGLIMFRHVFMKLCKIQKTHIIFMSDFTAALRVAVGILDGEGQLPREADAECIDVNLIGEDLVKAHVWWRLKKFVASKTDPFPSLSKIQTKNAVASSTE